MGGTAPNGDRRRCGKASLNTSELHIRCPGLRQKQKLQASYKTLWLPTCCTSFNTKNFSKGTLDSSKPPLPEVFILPSGSTQILSIGDASNQVGKAWSTKIGLLLANHAVAEKIQPITSMVLALGSCLGWFTDATHSTIPWIFSWIFFRESQPWGSSDSPFAGLIDILRICFHDKNQLFLKARSGPRQLQVPHTWMSALWQFDAMLAKLVRTPHQHVGKLGFADRRNHENIA